MKKILSIVAVIVLLLLVTVIFFLGQIVKTAIETVGPKAAGVSMTVEKVRVYPLAGRVRIKGLIIGNPEGFNTPSAMELGDFRVNVSIGSLFTDTIVVKEILIEAPEITYEKSLRSSNLATLQKNLAPKEAGDEPEKEAEKTPEKKSSPAKKLIIEDFQLNNAKVNVTITELGGKKLSLPLPNIQLKDIGKDTGGADIQQVVSEVLASVSDSVVKAASSSKEVVNDAVDGIKKGIGGLFGKE